MATLSKAKSTDDIPDDKSVSAGQLENVDNRTPALGYDAVDHQRQSTATPLFQSLVISAPPFAISTPLINAMYGGCPLSLLFGSLVVGSLAQCVVFSVAELALNILPAGLDPVLSAI